MNRFIAVGTILFSLILLSSFDKNPSVHETMRVNGSPTGHAGDPAGGNKTCNTTGCHTGPAVVTQTGWISSTIPASGYLPGTTYTITATVTDPGHTKFGFQVSPQSLAGVQLGTLISTSTQTSIVGTTVKYINQNNTGTAGVGSKSWSFNWTAPSAGAGTVNFYGAFNSTNSSNNSSGDTIYKSVLTVNEDQTVGIKMLTNLNENVVLYPVPSKDFVNVKIADCEDGKMKIDLLDSKGELVALVFDGISNGGEFEKRIELSSLGLSAGVYFLKISNQNASVLKRIIIA